MSKPFIELKENFREYLVAIIELTEDMEEINYIELEPCSLAKRITLTQYSCWQIIIESIEGVTDLYTFINGQLQFVNSEYPERG